ncbi:hypothetical protein BCR41DRAFT_289857, partial [Lobosporangium transversale]
ECLSKAEEHERQMIQYNREARDIVFKVNNTFRASNELDLHGLKVKEALEVVSDRIKAFTKDNEKKLIIIVGRGRNSWDGVPKLRPAVNELLKKYNVKATRNKPNDGCILVQ